MQFFKFILWILQHYSSLIIHINIFCFLIFQAWLILCMKNFAYKLKFKRKKLFLTIHRRQIFKHIFPYIHTHTKTIKENMFVRKKTEKKNANRQVEIFFSHRNLTWSFNLRLPVRALEPYLLATGRNHAAKRFYQ